MLGAIEFWSSQKGYTCKKGWFTQPLPQRLQRIDALVLVWLWNCQHEIEHPFQVPQVLYTSDTPENQSAEASPSPKCLSPMSLLIIRPIARSIKVAAASCMIASCQVLTHTNTRLDNYREMQQKKSSKLQQWMQCNIENSHRKTITAKCNRRKAKNYNNWCNTENSHRHTISVIQCL